MRIHVQHASHLLCSFVNRIMQNIEWFSLNFEIIVCMAMASTD